MATNFGKGNRAIAFNPTSAFPLDARTYFESYDEALAKAQTAEEVGSTNTQYHYGMKLLVKEGENYNWYTISTENTLVAEASEGFDAFENISNVTNSVDSISEKVYADGFSVGYLTSLITDKEIELGSFYTYVPIPIAAGENITITADFENKVYKISSKGNDDVILSDGKYIQGQGSDGTLFNVLGVSDDQIYLGISGKDTVFNGIAEFNSAIYLRNNVVLTREKAIRSTLSSGASVDIAKVNSSNQLLLGSTSCATQIQGTSVSVPKSLVVKGDSYSNYFQVTGNGSNPIIRLYNGNLVFMKSDATIINAIYSYSTYANLSGTWKLNSATISTSWRGAKHDIEEIPDRYSVLFDNLRPVRFKYNDGTSGRYHTGLILEEMKDAMDVAGVDSSEFACYCILDKETGEGGIRYEELISLAISEVQKLKKKNQELEQRIVELEAKLQP